MINWYLILILLVIIVGLVYMLIKYINEEQQKMNKAKLTPTDEEKLLRSIR